MAQVVLYDQIESSRMNDQECEHRSVTNLVPAVYRELRKIAANTMAKLPSGSTLQPTALVHEAWLRLGGTEWQSRGHFLAAAAEAMRHILIDRARQRSAVRHGGGQQRIDIDQLEIPLDTEDDERLLAVNAAMERLANEHPQAANLVKLRCFVGLEISEAAQALGIPRTTAYRRWQFAVAWLYRDLHDQERSA
jgi:RNA polymerase sigma factor (TIGR02999 family)